MSGRERSGTAEGLRRAFDRGFALPARPPRQDTVSLLAIRLAGAPAALRVLDTLGLMAAPRIVPVPSRRPELLGIAGVRGAVVPIYGLARLLGHGEDGDARWIVLAGERDRVGLAFSVFERHLVVPAHDVREPAQGAPAHVSEVLCAGSDVRPVLSVTSLLRAITAG